MSGCTLQAGPTGRCEALHNAQWPLAQRHREPSQVSPRSRFDDRHPGNWSDIAAVKAGRVDPPETMRQAQRHDLAVLRYTSAGLCRRCASQAAWAGQIGYARVWTPCGACALIVCTFPGAEHVNGWRSLPEMSRDRHAQASAAGSGGSGPRITLAPTPVGNDAIPVAA